jgi:hypothetical protein
MSVDGIELAVFQNAMHSIAEEMGAALRRTAVSPNIKERRDYSCAVFDSRAHVVAMGDHMPVHLGSMPMSVEAVVGALRLVRAARICRTSRWCKRSSAMEWRGQRFMWPRGRTTPMWVGCLPGRWGRRGRSIRRAYGFLRCGWCGLAWCRMT